MISLDRLVSPVVFNRVHGRPFFLAVVMLNPVTRQRYSNSSTRADRVDSGIFYLKKRERERCISCFGAHAGAASKIYEAASRAQSVVASGGYYLCMLGG